jgi:hypothetical protein
MDSFHPPQPLNMDGDLGLSWQKWLRRFRQYLAAKEADKKSDATKIGMLLSAIGEEAEERFDQLQWESGEDKTKFETVVAKLDKEFSGETRVVFNRYVFWSQARPEGQKFKEYLTQLRTLAARCEFKEVDNMIRDKIIFSETDQSIKQNLLEQRNPGLDKVISTCQAVETTRNEAARMKDGATHPNNKQVNAMRSEQHDSSHKIESVRYHQQNRQATRKPHQQSKFKRKRNHADECCSRCGRHDHDADDEKCPAWGKLCTNCQRRNHFANQCRSNKSQRRMNNLDQCEGDDSDDYVLGALTCLHIDSTIEEKRAWFNRGYPR